MMTHAELDELRRARWILDHPSLAMRIADTVGRPLEWGLAALPAGVSRLVNAATRKALDTALGAALKTIAAGERAPPSNALHRGLVAASGAAGGFFGLAAVAAELPLSTTLMLRSVADHARAQGEDLASPAVRMECMAVFALGGTSRRDDAADVGYYATRIALARAVAEAAEHVAGRGLVAAAAERGAPALVRFVAAIAERYGIAVGEKIAAQAVPILGAAGGAAVNVAFMNHFQDVAWAHFTIRRLERHHGMAAVRGAFERLLPAGSPG